MFPDSESMTLHLTAAFLSDAGLSVLDVVNAATAGAGETFCIYSKTAAKAVRGLKIPGNPPEMVLRTKDTDAVDKRKELQSHSETAKTIDHVVVVLRKAANGDLLVVTAYPSDAPTSQTMQYPTAPGEDVEEHGRANYKKTSQAKALPTLVW